MIYNPDSSEEENILVEVKSKNVLKPFEEIKTNKSDEKDEKTTNSLQIKEISLDQSPLELATSRIESGHDSEDMEQKQDNENKLRLVECERNLEQTNNLIRNFKLLIDDLILSSSPFITYQMPFLLVDSDVLCKYLQNSHKKYLNSDILLRDSTSIGVTSKSSTAVHDNSSNTSMNTLEQDNSNLHEFLLLHFSKSFDDSQLKRLYADFKSRGGIAASTYRNRILIDETEKFSPEKKSYLTNDCLDVFNRQHLAVLFCSQCENSPVYPNMCHMPKIINLKFYGENDMTLGS